VNTQSSTGTLACSLRPQSRCSTSRRLKGSTISLCIHPRVDYKNSPVRMVLTTTRDMGYQLILTAIPRNRSLSKPNFALEILSRFALVSAFKALPRYNSFAVLRPCLKSVTST
jgi:hypothetical protein